MSEEGREANDLGLEPLAREDRRIAVLRAEGLTKRYAAITRVTGQKAGSGELELFRGLNLEVVAGEMVAIVGESGAGKSSLLHLDRKSVV